MFMQVSEAIINLRDSIKTLWNGLINNLEEGMHWPAHQH